VITADTYTSVLPLAQRKCADATAKLVLAADRRTWEKIRGKSRRNRRNQRRPKGMPRASQSVTTPPWHPPSTGDRRKEAAVPRFRRSTAS